MQEEYPAINEINVINTDENFIFSKKAFLKKMGDLLFKEISPVFYTAFVAACIILIFTFKNLKFAFAAVLPNITALIWFTGFMSFFKIVITPLHVISMILVIGLCMDYGIFMVHYSFNNDVGILKGVVLSALTTIASAGILFFLAKHPVLNSIGMTLFFGVMTGFLASVIIIPAILVKPQTTV